MARLHDILEPASIRTVSASRRAPKGKAKRRRGPSVEERLKDIQHEVLVAVASGKDLAEVMSLLCIGAEELTNKVFCTILRIDEGGRLHTLAAPSLPEAYSQAIAGIEIGPMVGSCGSAAYFGEPVEVTSIANDPRWDGFRENALALGLKACWSSPIKAHNGRVVGTFAFYFPTPRRANKLEKRIVDRCVHLCALAIEHWEANARIHQLAYRDPLTGLGNRALLSERFSEILARAAETGKEVAVLYADVDGFQTINNLGGQKAGDLLLRNVAERILAVSEGADLVTRLGGDEFLIVQTEQGGRAEIEALAERLSTTLRRQYTLEGGLEVKAAASTGIACFPGDGEDLDALMGHADTALRRVKRAGRGGHAFYTPEMDAEKHARRAFERDISLAVAAGQLTVVYQPQADAKTRTVQGFEALLRWKHPIHGYVSPEKFIPAAEACGVIEEIGAFVLREAMTQAARWPTHLRVAVNVSPAQIVHADFAQLVEYTLAESGVDPRRLEIEVTESLFIRDSDAALSTLQRLKALGVSVSIDDFGTGYSSLSTLRSFPFDRIKIDRSFVFDMVANADAAAIVNSIMGLGRALGRRVVAEGVETCDQLEALLRLGCSEVQGYLIGKPLPITCYSHITSVSERTGPKIAAGRAKKKRTAVA